MFLAATLERLVAALMREGWMAEMVLTLCLLLSVWKVLVKNLSLLHLLKLFHSVFQNTISESKIIDSCLENIDGSLGCVKFNFGILEIQVLGRVRRLTFPSRSSWSGC